ncbi:MAG: Coenzyme F420 hydrogenase/dehydrogenase, beta subunit C-terminal domain [Candidatus Lokiarchaeota archaeon]|nr:Coenzyme F420 hydrogenase/dehydrogenase, beta subunit C-terminal domain [Candidatus Lokiarchaeota archaeon]
MRDVIKVFTSLNREIIKENLCCSCGACVAYCENQNYDVIKMKNDIPQYKSNDTKKNCILCGVCYNICPQTDTIKTELDQLLGIENEIGPIYKIMIARTLRSLFNEFKQDGGLVSTILEYLFENNKINAAIVSTYDKNLKPIPKIILNKSDLIHSAGTRYSVSPQILPFKELSNLTKRFLKENNNEKKENLKLAFVGTPCQVKTIRKMQYFKKIPSQIIKYIIGLFCLENFYYDKFYNLIEREINVKSKDIKRINIKKKVFIKTYNKGNFEIELNKFDSAIRNNCIYCDDFTSKYSDISIGGTGAPEGYSLILIRNQTSKDLFNNMISDHYIVEHNDFNDKNYTEWKENKIKLLKRMILLKKKKNEK